MERFLWVGVAGAFGTWTRYLVSTWAGRAFGATFPVGTLIVNVSGCFLIASVMQLALATTFVPPTLRLVLTTGFIGGLTTYSSFNFETSRLVQEGAWGIAAANFAVTTIGCFAAGVLGMVVTRQLFGT
jgi:fluoride exporter